MALKTVGKWGGLIAVASATVVSAQSSEQPHLRGFSAKAVQEELARERTFKSLPSPKTLEAYFDVLTAEPHPPALRTTSSWPTMLPSASRSSDSMSRETSTQWSSRGRASAPSKSCRQRRSS